MTDPIFQLSDREQLAVAEYVEHLEKEIRELEALTAAREAAQGAPHDVWIRGIALHAAALGGAASLVNGIPTPCTDVIAAAHEFERYIRNGR